MLHISRIFLICFIQTCFCLLQLERFRRCIHPIASLNLDTDSGGAKEVFHLLQGSFNNEQQHLNGASTGKFTAQDGGHEFVSVLIKKHSHFNNVLIAMYYYGTSVADTFRFRYYEFPNYTDHRKDAIMKIYRPKPDTDKQLKASRFDTSKYLPSLVYDFEYMNECDLMWRRLEEQPGGIMGTSNSVGPLFKGVLLNGECEIQSQSNPDITLIVKDDLILFRNQLWINDEVFIKSTGVKIIGNRDGIPYKLIRIGQSW